MVSSCHIYIYIYYELATLNHLKNLVLCDIDFFECLPNLLLPKSNKLLEWVYILRRSEVESFVQRSWIINSFDSVGCYVFFLVKDCCTRTNTHNHNNNTTQSLLILIHSLKIQPESKLIFFTYPLVGHRHRIKYFLSEEQWPQAVPL